jgi:hypothetical protein
MPGTTRSWNPRASLCIRAWLAGTGRAGASGGNGAAMLIFHRYFPIPSWA